MQEEIENRTVTLDHLRRRLTAREPEGRDG